MTRRRQRRTNPWRVGLLIILIGIGLYVNQVVVPATPPLFMPTPTPTTSPESHINQARELAAEGKLTAAISAYQRAIEAEPGNAALYVELSRLQVFDGDFEGAITNTQNALLKNPNNAMAHAIQGWALGFQGKFGEAELELKKALAIEPNNPYAHAFLAEVYINQGQYDVVDKAIEESNIAKQLDNSLFEVHRARGIVLLNTSPENIPYAIDELKSALAINKTIADVHLYLGLAYKAIGEMGLAEESLLAAYSYKPTDTTALTEISRAYFSDGRYRQAAQFAEEAVKVEPENPRLHGNLGIMHYKNEEYDKAIPELALAVEGGEVAEGSVGAPGTVVEGLPLQYGRVMEYYWYYGFALARARQCSKAVPIFQALLVGVPDDETAVYNANAGLEMCQQNLAEPPRPTETPDPQAPSTPAP